MDCYVRSWLGEKGSLYLNKYSEVQKNVRDTLASWRGENQCMQFHQHNHKVRPTNDSTFGDAERPTTKEEPIHSIQQITEPREHIFMQAGRDSGE